jgi:hypothetical protein
MAIVLPEVLNAFLIYKAGPPDESSAPDDARRKIAYAPAEDAGR